MDKVIEFNNFTVQEMLDNLRKISENYQFMVQGETNGYALGIDNDSNRVSIDSEEFIRKLKKEYPSIKMISFTEGTVGEIMKTLETINPTYQLLLEGEEDGYGMLIDNEFFYVSVNTIG